MTQEATFELHSKKELDQEQQAFLEDFIDKNLFEPRFFAITQEYLAVKGSSLGDPAVEQFLTNLFKYIDEVSVEVSGTHFDFSNKRIVVDDDNTPREVAVN